MRSLPPACAPRASSAAARSPIVEGVATTSLLGNATRSDTVERHDRMEARIRRMSSTPLGLTAGPSADSLRDSENTNGAASGGDSGGVPAGASGSSLGSAGSGLARISRVEQRVARAHRRASERTHEDRHRLTTVEYVDGAGEGSRPSSRPRIVSAADLFRPVELSRPSSSIGSDTGSSHKSSRKPSLEPIPNAPGSKPRQLSIDENAPMDMLEAAASSAAAVGGGGNGGAGEDGERKLRSPICELLSNGVYVCVVLSLSSLFFVVTGPPTPPEPQAWTGDPQATGRSCPYAHALSAAVACHLRAP